MYAAGFTDTGVARSQNQDSIFVCNKPIGPFPNLFIVADGMGGHNAGDVASAMAVAKFSGYIRGYGASPYILPENYLDLLVSAAQHAGGEIIKLAETEETMRGMGTTLTACVIAGEKIFIAHIGDSRAYSINMFGVKQLTTDHTYVEELLQSGKVSKKEALAHPKRHVLTRVLGIPGTGGMEIDGIVRELGESAAILMCSDGLSNMIDNDTLVRIVNGLGYVENRAGYLVDEANRRGGHDNISVILIDIVR
ncbi:MAG: Stp1/IreP family PP2C-type Ser/Thr phosphatase [Defluviitaleaceae bacterium]|nr:Stp1/IreP family PP2C-type Ser/Thr phosphatase [Defluviitaleaceae bacterium]